MPSSSKSPQALSTKSHSYLRKSTDESPSKTTSTSVPSEVRTSQSTNFLNPRYNESNHPEEDDVISDDDKTPEEIASAELRANRRRGYDPNSSLNENNTSFLSGVGSSVSSTPSLERAIEKKKIHSESDSDDLSSTQQVVEEFKMIKLCGKLKNDMFNMWAECCNKRSQKMCVVARK